MNGFFLLIPFLLIRFTLLSLLDKGAVRRAAHFAPMEGKGLLALCTISIVSFARPSSDGLNRKGIYGLSRNPMYVSYFLIFIGCAILTKSWMLGASVAIFQLSAHWIIRAEERWCTENFGETYTAYMEKVRRYI